VRRWLTAAATIGALAAPAAASTGADPSCTGRYGGVPARSGASLRFGIDPGIAGSVGAMQMPPVPDDPARDLAAVKALRPRGRSLVVRLNRLFWSDGSSGIAKFRRMAGAYTRAGFDVEIQVRYHPPPGEVGNISAWRAYVRRVVDALGPNRRVVAMTITNEVNVAISPNTSDGAYARAPDALIAGIEAAHAEAAHRGLHQLRFGFTYAYRFVPSQDAAFFAYLGAHGGGAFHRALGFVGLDFYPGTVYPPVIGPGDTYRAELAQAAGTLRRCFMVKAWIGSRVPIWITESGVPSSGKSSDAAQAAALGQLVRAARAYSGSFNITDYRWFNLRDSTSSPAAGLFAADGLLRADYSRKPAFAVYRRLIAAVGARSNPKTAAG
jgi:hypothetical protein